MRLEARSRLHEPVQTQQRLAREVPGDAQPRTVDLERRKRALGGGRVEAQLGVEAVVDELELHELRTSDVDESVPCATYM